MQPHRGGIAKENRTMRNAAPMGLRVVAWAVPRASPWAASGRTFGATSIPKGCKKRAMGKPRLPYKIAEGGDRLPFSRVALRQ
jgi:hypothetical protein